MNAKPKVVIVNERLKSKTQVGNLLEARSFKIRYSSSVSPDLIFTTVKPSLVISYCEVNESNVSKIIDDLKELAKNFCFPFAFGKS